MDEATLVTALKGKTVAVVLAPDGEPIDRPFADLLKPDTLILVLPAVKADPMPPPTVSNQ